jgi:ADP-ribosyl-[dinitrogen reductase] hydrolase
LTHIAGNGSIMRLAAVPVAYHDDEAMALDVASRQSKTTHQGDEAAELCRLMAFIIVRAINAKDSSKAFLDTLGQDFTTPLASVRHLASSQQEGEDPDRNWNWKASEYPLSMKRVRENAGYYGSYAMDGMCMALHCLYHSADFASAVLKCANMCGDAGAVYIIAKQSLNRCRLDEQRLWADGRGDLRAVEHPCRLDRHRAKVGSPGGDCLARINAVPP